VSGKGAAIPVALSCSMLKPLLVSPAHFQASLVCEGGPSPAKDFGSGFTYSSCNLNSWDRSWRSILVLGAVGLGPGLQGLSARSLACKIAHRMYRGRPIGRFIEEANCEATIYFTEPTTGLRLRVRLAAYHPDISFDLKTTRHAMPNAFARDAVEMGPLGCSFLLPTRATDHDALVRI